MENLEQAVWFVPDDSYGTWLTRQVSEVCLALYGGEPKISTPGENLTGDFHIVVGCPANNRRIADAEDLDLSGILPEGYILAWSGADATPVLYIAGIDARGAVYGTFAFFESLGCRFEISGDRYPKKAGSLPVSRMDLAANPNSAWRGFYFQYCFATNSVMSLPDYERMFDQMAKMRLNTICYYYFPNEPFLDFTFRGERKLVGDISHPDSGYMSYGRHFSGSYRVADVSIGSEKFNRAKVAPLEFQHVRSSEAALDTGKWFLNKLIAMAAERGIDTWISFLPTFVPLNFAKYLRPMPRPHAHWSALASATDPVLDEINTCRLEAIVADFPGLAGVFLGIPEGYFED